MRAYHDASTSPRFGSASCWAICLLAALAGQSAWADPYTADELVNAAVARRAAIFSGTIEFELTTGFVTKPEQNRTVRQSYSRSGDNWARRWPGTDFNTMVNVDGQLFEFTPNLPTRKLATHQLEIKNPRALEKNETYPGIFFLGTIWFASTADYVKAHVSDGVVEGPRDVNGIDTILLSWKIAEADKLAGFSSVAPPLLKGGTLQLYVAPQLGFALPRMAYLAPDGFQASTFDASEFKEDAPGIFFPRHYRVQHNQPEPGYFQDYTVKLVQDINQAVSDEKFVIDVPKGTRVVYSRGRKDAIQFTLGDQVNTADLDQVISEHLPQPQSGNWSKPRLLLVGLNVLVTAGLLSLVIVRYRTNKHSTGA